MIGQREVERDRELEPLEFVSEPQAQPPGERREHNSLWAELERVYRRLVRRGENADADFDRAASFDRLVPAALAALPERWNPVEKLREMFGLSEFETDILLLCAGAAIDRRFSAALSAVQPDSPYPTLGLAAAALENPHWSALSGMRSLRYWRLVEIGAGPLLQAPLTIDERILQYLLGVPAADERLELVIHPLAGGEEQVEGSSAARNVAAGHGALHWRRAGQGTILLTGNRASERIALFQAMCRAANLHAWVLDAGDLPDAPAERERLARAYTREAALWPAALLVRTDRVENAALLEAWLRRINAPVAVEVETGSTADWLSGLRLAAPSMSAAECKAQWQRRLGELSPELEPELDAMVEAFALDAKEIRETAEAIEEEAALMSAGQGDGQPLSVKAWVLCRTAARRSLDELASHVENTASWADLVLPEAQTGILR